MKIALLQLDPTVADFAGNLQAIEQQTRAAVAAGADLCVAPELALSGYPPHDLMLHAGFVAANERGRDALVALSAELGCGLLFGLVLESGLPRGKPLSNAAVLCDRGAVLAVKRKALLPTYDVFDERRYFAPDDTPVVATFRGVRVGLLICEDMWTDAGVLGPVDYPDDPAAECAALGAELLLNISASPWSTGKQRLREQLLVATARRIGLPVVMVNQVGANDDLIFDGGSAAVDAAGRALLRMPVFEAATALLDPFAPREAETWHDDDLDDELRALAFGVRGYFRKTGHQRALIGLSGGIDSALVTCIAARALGPENVHAISMPARYSSAGSVADSRQLAEALGVGFEVLDIDEAFELQRQLAGAPGGLAEENLQARIRGLLLMTRSNATGALVLATGNASELAVGYSTLYGDMCGALEVIGDVPKTRVYQLAARIPEMPEAILTKAPSAELRPDQTDQDSLPPYDVLDAILAAYLDERVGVDAMVARGLDPALCRRVVRMVEVAEYKRRQAPMVLRISPRAFGAGRRIPVAKRP